MQITQIKAHINEFIEWWITGLISLIPASTLHKIRYVPDQLLIEVTAGYFHCRLDQKEGPVLEWQIPRDKTIISIPSKISPDTHVILLLPQNFVLKKHITLPDSAADNLREILHFEIEKHTPFHREKVFFAWNDFHKDTINRKIYFNLFVIPRMRLDPLLAELTKYQIYPQTVTVNTNTFIDLQPNTQCVQSKNSQTIKFKILVAVTLIAMLAALYLPLLHYKTILEETQTKVADLESQANEAQKLIAEMDTLLTRDRFLNEIRQSHFPVISVLNELTKRLPDTTWLERMILRDHELQILGESDTAVSLIEILDESALFSDVRFLAPVTRNSNSGKDKFHITLKLSEPQS